MKAPSLQFVPMGLVFCLVFSAKVDVLNEDRTVSFVIKVVHCFMCTKCHIMSVTDIIVLV